MIESPKVVKTATGTVVRGDYKFAITVTSETGSPQATQGSSGTPTAARPQVHIAVWHLGRRVEAGRLERFAPEYLASLRYRLEFRTAKSKPVGRVGKVLIGPDAWEALRTAIAAASRRVSECADDPNAC